MPEELFVTNITTQPPDVEIHRPTGFIEPVIDGEVTSYFEWVGAGCVEAVETAGAMHQVAERHAGISVVEFGFDLENLFLRIDGTRSMREMMASGFELALDFLKPAGLRVFVRLEAGAAEALLLERSSKGDRQVVAAPGLEAAVGRVLEVQIPFRVLGVTAHAPIAFLVVLSRGGVEVEHHPRHRAIELSVPDRQFTALNWTA